MEPFFTKHLNEYLLDAFKKQQFITRDELLAFYRKCEPELKKATFGWRIYDLKAKGIIKQAGRNVYEISKKTPFVQGVGPNLAKIAKILNENFNEPNYNVWDTTWLGQFTTHQVINQITILEVEKDILESTFHQLKMKEKKNVYLNPDKVLMENYVAEEDVVIIIKPMISRAPTQTVKKVQVPTLEKILVDLFCDETIFYAFRGNELLNIYKNAIKNYSIDFSKLLNYARRRKRDEYIKDYITNHFPEIKEAGIL